MNNQTIKRSILPKKLTSIFIVSLLILTVFSTIDTTAKTNFNSLKNIKEKIKDKAIETIKNLNNKKTFLENINTAKTGTLSTKLLTFFKTARGIIRTKQSSSSLLLLYTNYGGDKEKTTPIKLGAPVVVDVDDDGDNDIKAKLNVFLGIERPFVLTFNFKLKVERLSGFNDVKEFFEIYIELLFPGLLDANNADDKVRFGYQSGKHEEVPDICYVTYKYVPYLFYKEKPKHKAKLDPGDIANKDSLSLLFSYINANKDSQDVFKIKFEPAVKVEVEFTGVDTVVGRSLRLDSSKSTTAVIRYNRKVNDSEFNAGIIIYKLSSFSFNWELTPFKKGGGKIEYERNSSDPVDALLFFEQNKSAYVFVDDIPKHILLSWTPEKDGLIELNSYGEHFKSIGVRDALLEEDVKAEAYIQNLPSLLKFKWNWRLFNGAELDIYADSNGCSAHIRARDLLGTGAEVKADFYTKNIWS